MFSTSRSALFNVARFLREETMQRGAIIFVLFWGVMCFGGGTLLWDVCGEVFGDHKPLVSILM
jgi:hypothetical protein